MKGNESVYVNWGDIPSRGEHELDVVATWHKLGDMVVERFHEMALENSSTANWVPRKGLVQSEQNDLDEGLDNAYEDWRQQAFEEVAEKWSDGTIEPEWKNAPPRPFRPLPHGY